MNKKHSRVILAAVLSAVMILSTCIPAFAADETEPVVVNDESVTVQGSVKIDGEQEAVHVQASNDDASAKVTGDVEIKNDYWEAEGVGAYSNTGNGNKASVDVAGNVKATGTGGTEANAVEVNAQFKGNEASVKVGKDVTAKSDDGYAVGIDSYSTSGAKTKAEVKGNVKAEGSDADGININNHGGTADIKVDGNVSAEASEDYGCGVDISMSSGSAKVDVGKDVSAKGKEWSDGIHISAGGSGGLSSPGNTSDDEQEDKTNVEVKVGGNVKADADGEWGAVGATTYNGGAVIDITIGGNIDAGTTGIIAGNGIYGGYGDGSTGGQTNISVGGNVTGGDCGLEINNGGIVDYDIFVKEIIKGGEVGVVVYEDQYEGYPVSEDSKEKVGAVSLTVWKIELNERGNAAEYFGNGDYPDGPIGPQEDEGPKAATTFESGIKYIIKLEQPKEGGSLSATDAKGKDLETSHDYEVANEGDRVLLKVDLLPGYKIVGAFNGLGEKVKLKMDSKGNYYIDVPKGGGVYLSVELGKEKYDVVFENEDGTELQSEKMEYGDTPEYKGEEPEKESTAQYSYTFAGWEPEINPVTGDITYKAVFDEVLNKYDISFDLGGGTLDGESGTVVKNYDYGTVFELPAPVREGYRFLYWKGSQYNAGDSYTVDGAHTFTAVWEKIEEKKEETKPSNGGDNSGSSVTTVKLAAVGAPPTADNHGLYIWLILMALAVAAAAVVIGMRKRV